MTKAEEEPMPEARDLHPLRLLAISGSLRRASTNTAVLEALADLAPDDVEVTIYRGLAELPAFNADDDEDDPPEQVRALRGLVASLAGHFHRRAGVCPWRARRPEECA